MSRTTAEVRYLEVARVREQHVARLDVPVSQAVGVQVCQAPAHLQDVPVVKETAGVRASPICNYIELYKTNVLCRHAW